MFELDGLGLVFTQFSMIEVISIRQMPAQTGRNTGSLILGLVWFELCSIINAMQIIARYVNLWPSPCRIFSLDSSPCVIALIMPVI